MQIMGEGQQETSWQEEIRGKGCEEQLVHPHQAEGFLGLKHRVQNGWTRTAPTSPQAFAMGALLLQPPAMVWVENSLCALM